VLEHVGRAVDDECGNGWRAGREPAVALLRDHDRLERDVLRAKELLDQATERSARMREEGEPVLHRRSFT
jgi:hypothetical protein